MAVLHTTYYDVWPWPMTLTTKVAKECKNEKHKNNLTVRSTTLLTISSTVVEVAECGTSIQFQMPDQVGPLSKTTDRGSPKFTLGALHPWDAPRGKNYYSRKVHLILSKCLKNFNFLAVTVFEIRYDISHIYTRGRCAPQTPLEKKFWRGHNFTLGVLHPETPLAEKCHFRKVRLTISKCVQNFNFLVLIIPEIWAGSKFTLRGTNLH